MYTLNCNGRLLVIDTPVIMAIINATPDSFYAGSRKLTTDQLLRHAEKCIRDGATILDIGGQSTRPGSIPVSAEEELSRVIPGVAAIHERFPDVIISIDTYHSIVARDAVDAGASIINDVSAGTMDELLIPVVASLNVPYVLTHIKGTPVTMQSLAVYEDLEREITDFMIGKMEQLKQAGVHDVIIDPGFGFAKTIPQNFRLLRHLDIFGIFERPLLVGLSRKGTIYRTLEIDAARALNGSTVMHTIALMNGANILRVHDVKEAKEAITLFNHYRESE